MKLNTLITPDIRWLTNRFTTFNLPTECVVTQPTIVAPKQGRCYETGHYLRGESILSYESLRVLPDFNGTSHEQVIFLYEVWEDYGMDGHADYQLRGWTLQVGPVANPHHLNRNIE